MLDIKEILNREFVMEGKKIPPKQAEYLFKKFLLSQGIYEEFVEEFISYQQKGGNTYLPKQVIKVSVKNLADYPFYDITQRYDTSFDWSKTKRGRNFWCDVHDKWKSITHGGYWSPTLTIEQH
jgi:hypothetical protein